MFGKLAAILSIMLWMTIAAIDPLCGALTLVKDATIKSTAPPQRPSFATYPAMLDDEREAKVLVNTAEFYTTGGDLQVEFSCYQESFPNVVAAKSSLYKFQSRFII